MSTAEEVLNKWYKPLYGIGSLEYIMITEAMKEYAIEVSKEALKNASDKVRRKDFIFVNDYNRCVNLTLSETNIPELK